MNKGMPKLSCLMALMTPVRTPDGAGGYAEVWSELGKLWAEVAPRTGRASGEAALPLSRTGFRITVRAAEVGSPRRPMPGQRLEHGDRRFVIEAVTERDADGRFLTVMAREDVVAT